MHITSGLKLALLCAGLVAAGGLTGTYSPAANAADGSSQLSIVSGADPAGPPFVYLEDGVQKGFDVDMLRAIGKAEGIKVSFKSMSFDGVIPSLQSGAIDVAADGVTITKSRLKTIYFSDAYYKTGLSILVPKSSKIGGYADLKGHVIATKKGSSSVVYLKKHGFDMANVKQFQNISAAYQALTSGSVDAVIFDNPINVAFKQKDGNVKFAGDLLTGEYYGIAISKKHPELVKKLNAGLAKIKQNGEYKKLFKKWFGGDLSGAVEGTVTPEQAVAPH